MRVLSKWYTFNMAEDAEQAEPRERPRVRITPIPHEKRVIKVEGYRIVELPNDRNSETIGIPREDRPRVFVEDTVYGSVSSHLAADLRFERGGLLLGYRNRTPGGETHTHVTGFFPATRGHGTEIEFNINHDDFAGAIQEIGSRGRGEEIIGWVHSHPHHPPAPSPHRDFFIMQSFFQPTPEHFTFIANPNTNQVGLFRWEDGQPSNQGGFVLIGDLRNHGLKQRPRVVRTNSLNEGEQPLVKVHPETFWQRVQGWINSLTRSR